MLSRQSGLDTRADGALSLRQKETLEELRRDLGATKTQLKRAYALGEKDSFTPEPVGSFSDKVQNLEEALFLSLLGAASGAVENHKIIVFAKAVGVTSDQLNMMLDEVQSQLADEPHELTCLGCGESIDGASKFCSHCGHTIGEQENDAKTACYQIPTSGVVVEFAESTAVGFPGAVQIAESAAIYSTGVKGKKTWYMAAWPLTEMPLVVELVDNLKGMRNRKVHIDGKEHKWDDVFGFAWCAEQRNSAFRPVEYCFGVSEKRLNIWGCIQVRMDWADWADWFGYGSFKEEPAAHRGGVRRTTDYTFVFNKERIKHEVMTALHKYRFCPYVNLRLVEAVLRTLPDEVSPSHDKSWMYKREYEQTPGSVSIHETIIDEGERYSEEYFASGVAPRSPSVGLQILERAIAMAGITDSDVRKILEIKV